MVSLYLLHFQTGRFRQFWDEAAKSRHIVEAVPGNNKLQCSEFDICWCLCIFHLNGWTMLHPKKMGSAGLWGMISSGQSSDSLLSFSLLWWCHWWRHCSFIAPLLCLMHTFFGAFEVYLAYQRIECRFWASNPGICHSCPFPDLSKDSKTRTCWGM